MEDVKLQDFFYPMLSVAASGKAGMDLCWEFFQTRLPELQAKLKAASPSLMSAVISICCGGFTTSAKADELEKFFKANPMKGQARGVEQMLEKMRSAAGFAERLRTEKLGAVLDELTAPMA